MSADAANAALEELGVVPKTARRHRQHGNPFSIRGKLDRPNWKEMFGREAPFALDIGCGLGCFLLELARLHPEWNAVGFEIRKHFVDHVKRQAQALALPNVDAVLANANSQLDDLIPEKSVAFVSLNFPDPWYKRRHHKRRVLQESWLDLLVKRLIPNAELHIMTDVAPLAYEMRDVLVSDHRFVHQQSTDGFATCTTTGIKSEREKTHEARKEPIYRLHFRLA